MYKKVNEEKTQRRVSKERNFDFFSLSLCSQDEGEKKEKALATSASIHLILLQRTASALYHDRQCQWLDIELKVLISSANW